MDKAYPSRTQIEAHLKELSLQEQDAMMRLGDPEIQPALRHQLHRLILRLHEERAGIERSLKEVVAT